MAYLRPKFKDSGVTLSDVSDTKEPEPKELTYEEHLAKTKELLEAEKVFDDGKAKYKIEVMFLDSRKKSGLSPVQMSAWESGKKLNGGGDVSMFWCKNADNMDEGCMSPISESRVRGGVAYCDTCKKAVNVSLLPVMIAGAFTTKGLAKEVYKTFVKLNRNADIYLKFHRTDAEGMTRVRAENLQTSEAAIYPLASIIRDTSNGSDVLSKIEAFLTA